MGAIFASRLSVALVIFFGLESHIGKISFFFLPYKAWANGVRVPLVIYIIVGAIFASRPSVALVIFFDLESHIGKILFLFLPYKVWANGIRIPLVWLPPYMVVDFIWDKMIDSNSSGLNPNQTWRPTRCE